MTSHSLKKRFVYKLLGNIAALALGIVALSIATRALGPADFGRFEFVMTNFNLVLSVLSLQLPVAYFNWISRKGHKENTDYPSGFILYFSFLIIVLFGIFIGVSVMLGINHWIWPEIRPVFLWLALVLSSAMFIYQLCSYLADGRAMTVGLEKIRFLQNIIKTVGILALFVWGMLTLENYFIIQLTVVLISVVLSIAWLGFRGAYSQKVLSPWRCDRQSRQGFHEFAIQYTRPLIGMMLVGFCFLYFDRWFLQLIAGSSQQGYFSLSERLGTLAIMFTAAMTPLLTREFAFAYEERNMVRLASLFERIKLFYFIAAVFGCFMSVQSAEIVEIIGGEKYKDAVIPFAIMAMYPIHQTFGQLSAALLTATGQTKLYAKLAILILFASAPVTYFLMAPSEYIIPGFALGATGLAIKMVLIQIIGTNIQLYFNTKMLNLSFVKWVLYQFKTVFVVYLLAALAYWLSRQVPNDIFMQFNMFDMPPIIFNQLTKLSIAGVFYIGLLGLLLVLVPNIANLKKSELTELVRRKLIDVQK